mmetsp:Transcript_102473/g.298905  ORF Transcript_102473/g.298905 Transcript_102473/m.298905 type:complete len:227 (+) Transcript_102473:1422-2102(+)
MLFELAQAMQTGTPKGCVLQLLSKPMECENAEPHHDQSRKNKVDCVSGRWQNQSRHCKHGEVQDKPRKLLEEEEVYPHFLPKVLVEFFHTMPVLGANVHKPEGECSRDGLEVDHVVQRGHVVKQPKSFQLSKIHQVRDLVVEEPYEVDILQHHLPMADPLLIVLTIVSDLPGVLHMRRSMSFTKISLTPQASHALGGQLHWVRRTLRKKLCCLSSKAHLHQESFAF